VVSSNEFVPPLNHLPSQFAFAENSFYGNYDAKFGSSADCCSLRRVRSCSWTDAMTERISISVLPPHVPSRAPKIKELAAFAANSFIDFAGAKGFIAES
jgi:hypothetical protein